MPSVHSRSLLRKVTLGNQGGTREIFLLYQILGSILFALETNTQHRESVIMQPNTIKDSKSLAPCLSLSNLSRLKPPHKLAPLKSDTDLLAAICFEGGWLTCLPG